MSQESNNYIFLCRELWTNELIPLLHQIDFSTLGTLCCVCKFFFTLFDDVMWKIIADLEIEKLKKITWKPSQVYNNWDHYKKPRNQSPQIWLKNLITPNLDWMEQSDEFGGMRQSKDNPKFWFAIGKTNTWDLNLDYGLPRGYHWASLAEYRTFAKNCCTENAYSGSSWVGYQYNGVYRHGYVFCDTYLYSRWRHENIQQVDDFYKGGINTTHMLFGNCFAGIVVMEDTHFSEEERIKLEEAENIEIQQMPLENHYK